MWISHNRRLHLFDVYLRDMKDVDQIQTDLREVFQGQHFLRERLCNRATDAKATAGEQISFIAVAQPETASRGGTGTHAGKSAAASTSAQAMSILRLYRWLMLLKVEKVCLASILPGESPIVIHHGIQRGEYV